MNDPLRPFDDAAARRLCVFGHPAHELAVFGIIQRFRPAIVMLTDGGSSTRVDDSRRALDSIGALARTTFLDYTEQDFYRALVNHDVALFSDVVQQVRSIVQAVQPTQVFCDAIEFYNPVHDITFPVARAAIGVRPGTALYEVPIVYQRNTASEEYAIQRVPDVLASRRIVFNLAAHELQRKSWARTDVYHVLRQQAAVEFQSLSDAYLGREEIALAGDRLPTPEATGRVLRYEWRARLLREQGHIRREITLMGDFLPVARQLIDTAIEVA